MAKVIKLRNGTSTPGTGDISDKEVRAKVLESAKKSKGSKPKTLTEEQKENLRGSAIFLEKQIAGFKK